MKQSLHPPMITSQTYEMEHVTCINLKLITLLPLGFFAKIFLLDLFFIFTVGISSLSLLTSVDQ